MYRYLLFDLDGTLLDTYEGVARSVVYALKSLGKPIPDQKELRRYLGPSLSDSFAKIAGLRGAEIERAVLAYRERYETVGVYEYRFFEEVCPTLERLRRRGFVLAVATAKPTEFAELVLKDAGIYDAFDFVGGATKTDERTRKEQVIAHVLRSLNISDRSEVLMIGDRDNDVSGAKANNIACCGALYGYGGRTELIQSGADLLIGRLSELLIIL